MEPFFQVGERTERPGRPGERFGVSKDLRVAASTVAGWRARQGWYQRSASHRQNRKFHLSGRPAPGPQMGNGAVPFAKTKRGAAAPGALGARSHCPAPGHSGRLPGPRRRAPSARPSPTSGRELYLSPARRSLEPPPSLRARLLFMVPVAGRESQRRGPRGWLAPIAVGARGTQRTRGTRGRTGARSARAARGRGAAGAQGARGVPSSGRSPACRPPAVALALTLPVPGR